MATKGKELKVNDRVKKANVDSILGVVKEIRQETQVHSLETRERAKMVNVLWDNGTRSYLDPDALEVVESK